METNRALSALDALAQPTRLAVFRLLVAAEPEGLHAGEIALRLGLRPNTLSAALAVLLRAGLVGNAREGRAIRYRAEMAGLGALVGFLVQDCCGGRPELCNPLIAQASCGCAA